MNLTSTVVPTADQPEALEGGTDADDRQGDIASHSKA